MSLHHSLLNKMLSSRLRSHSTPSHRGTAACFACRVRKKLCQGWTLDGITYSDVPVCFECFKFNIFCDGHGKQLPLCESILSEARYASKQWIRNRSNRDFNAVMPLNLTKVLKGYPRRRQYIRWQVDTTAVPPDRGDLLLSENPLLSVWQPGRSGFSPPHSAPPVVGIFAGFPVPNHRRICEVEVETNSLFVGHMPTLPPTHDTFPDGTPTPMSPPPPYEADTGFAFNDVCHSQQSYSSMQVNAGSVDESFQSGCDQSAFTDTHAITQMKAWPRSGDDSPDDTHYY